MSRKTNMGLAGRFWGWVLPMSEAELEVFRLEREILEDYSRILKAEADAKELQVRDLKAKVALQEEANGRERKLRKELEERFHNQALITYNLRLGNTPITTIATLAQNSEGTRQVSLSSTNKKGGRVSIDNDALWAFLEAQPSYKLWVAPWHNGGLEIKDLRKMVPDDCFEGIEFVGGKKP